MSEKKYDFSEDKSGDIFRQLPPEEKEAVIGAVQEEMADIHKKASELAGEGEKPTSRHYQNASEQIDGEKEKSEIILTPEQEEAKKEMIMNLSRGHVENALKIKDKFNLPEEIIQSFKIQSAARQGFIECLSYYTNFNAAVEIKDKFNLSEKIAQEIVKQRIIHIFSRGYNFFDALTLMQEFSLPEEILYSPEIQKSAEQAFKILLKDNLENSKNNLIKIAEKFNWSDESVMHLVKEVFLDVLSRAEITQALKIKEAFGLTIIPQEIIEKIPEIKEFLDKIRVISPDFYNQALKSVDVVISLIQFKNNPEQFIQEIQENPFLLNAVSENPRFGSKLLIKYPQFDELSKKNIKTLFGAKKEILANNPDIEPTSLEFRQLMQEKLKEYKNNPEILKAIQESGINIDEWLNYSETKYFNLEAGDSHLVFSETI